MRIAAYHNLPAGGALRTANEQFTRLGDQISAAYMPDSCSDESLPDSVKMRPIRLPRCRQFGRPFGRLNGLMNIMDMQSANNVAKKVAAEIDSGGYDVILAHSCSVTQTPWVLKYARTPSVYYCHEPFRVMHEELARGSLFCSPTDPLRALASRKAISAEYDALRNTTTVLCNSHYTHEYLMRSYGINARVNYPGVDTDVFHPRELPKTNTVLSVGRLSFLKGHEFVIDSLVRIPAGVRPILHIVCGPSNPEASIAAINRYAAERGIQIELEIDITDDRLAELYGCAVACLAAPVLEPFGLVPLESMACGTPVIGVAEGGIRESVVDQVTGFLTNRDSSEFAQALTYLLNNPDKAEEMGKAGVEYVRNNWTWEKSITDLQKILHDTARMRS